MTVSVLSLGCPGIETQSILTKEESPVQIINSSLGELRHNEATHPVSGSGCRCTARPPAKGVDLGVENPGDFGETRTVEEVVQEEEGGGDLSELRVV